MNKDISTQVFYILLALSLRPRHGYDIMKQVRQDSDGKIQLGPGTLYGAIKRMIDEKWITEVKIPQGEDARRKYYKLTEKGRVVLASELKRYSDSVKVAKKYSLVSLDLRF